DVRAAPGHDVRAAPGHDVRAAPGHEPALTDDRDLTRLQRIQLRLRVDLDVPHDAFLAAGAGGRSPRRLSRRHQNSSSVSSIAGAALVHRAWYSAWLNESFGSSRTPTLSRSPMFGVPPASLIAAAIAHCIDSFAGSLRMPSSSGPSRSSGSTSRVKSHSMRGVCVPRLNTTLPSGSVRFRFSKATTLPSMAPSAFVCSFTHLPPSEAAASASSSSAMWLCLPVVVG